jgi:outer membrane protein assembly factor BamB
MPVMGDIDNDGDQEIVMKAGNNVVAVNGKTGNIEWSVTIGSGNGAVELVDLNNDGTPEILCATSFPPRLHALNGNGSTRWITPPLKGEGITFFPIIAHDIDGEGYPTIYFASEDTTPDPYSGNPDDYDGALTMLDHNGNVLADTWIRHPCWGGLALADADLDGQFEVYLGDRRDGYHDMPADGLQAFNAHTLEQLWARPDIQHSSPMPILADVTGDGFLELIATQITLDGPIILDPTSGNTIVDYSNRGLPTHGTPTVYDIDEDGNLEFITATSYPSRAPRNFVVFDLVNGTIDFQASFDFWIAWPPKVGDVTGDGHMEILVATGSQEDTVGDTHDGDYPLLVYDKNFTLIDWIEIKDAGQLTPARVYDTDSDGYNEVVVAGFNGKLLVYDTDAPTADPAPRTWVQFYSEYRRGAAEYVPPPGS